MSRNLELAVVLRLKDQMGRASQQAMRLLEQSTRSAGQAARQAGTAFQVMERLRGPHQLVSGLQKVAREARVAERAVGMLSRSMAGLQKMGAVAGGVAAGAWVMKQPVQNAMNWDMRLANMANTAYAGRSLKERQAGMKVLGDAAFNAAKVGGTTKEAAAETLDKLLASGAMKQDTAMRLLPTLTKAATASGSDPQALADIAIRSMQNFGIKEADVPKALNMAIAAGQAGGFELKDMAKWLPQQMAAAKPAGFSGLDGMKALLAANQASAITAGSKDEAGNNLVNLLAKLNSQDTASDARKLGINLTGTLLKARSKGINGLDAFAGMIDTINSKDKRYQALKQKLATTHGSEQQQTLSDMANIAEGSSIGKLVQDRQALMALIAYTSNGDYLKQVHSAIQNSGKTVDDNYALIAGTAGFKSAQGDLAIDKAQTGAFGGLAETVGDLKQKLADYADKYPALATALVGATTGLTALATAITASGLLGLGGRGAVAAGSGQALATAGGAAATSRFSWASRASPFIAALTLTGDTAPESPEAANARWQAERAKRIKELEARLGKAKQGQLWRSGWFSDGYESAPANETQQYIKQAGTTLSALKGSKDEAGFMALLKQLTLQQAKPQEVKLTVTVNPAGLASVVNTSNDRTARRH